MSALSLAQVGTACAACAVLVANGDDSHMDAETADEVMATVGAIQRDEGGTVVVEAPADERSELFSCALCSEVVVSRPYALMVAHD